MADNKKQENETQYLNDTDDTDNPDNLVGNSFCGNPD